MGFDIKTDVVENKPIIELVIRKPKKEKPKAREFELLKSPKSGDES